MVRILAAMCVSACVCATVLSAQQGAPQRGDISSHSVPSGMMYHRIWAVMPLTGSGTLSDPKRPLLIPAAPQARQPGDRSGILGYQMQLSDDGKSALIEMVFATPTAFQTFLQAQARRLGVTVPATASAQTSQPASAGSGSTPSSFAAASAAQTAIEAAVPGLKIFERGKASDQTILAEFQKYKAKFTLNSAMVRVQ